MREKDVLIVKNHPLEGPGTIETYLKDRGIRYQIIENYRDEGDIEVEEFSHLVILGGPMGVYERDNYPFLNKELEWIEEFGEREAPVLGICLGAQLMAHALGGRVYPGPGKELGWMEIKFTFQGKKDRIFGKLAANSTSDIDKAEVLQLHGDTFELPRGAVRLAESELYPNQAFRWGRRFYALQFHIEVEPAEYLKKWFEPFPEVDPEQIVGRAEEIFESYRERAFRFYRYFFEELGNDRS